MCGLFCCLPRRLFRCLTRCFFRSLTRLFFRSLTRRLCCRFPCSQFCCPARGLFSCFPCCLVCRLPRCLLSSLMRGLLRCQFRVAGFFCCLGLLGHAPHPGRSFHIRKILNLGRLFRSG